MQMGIILLFFLFIFSLHPPQYCAEVYNITSSQPLAQGQVLVSPGHLFELGFFDGNKYVGIWYKNISPFKVVWVANSENPVTDTLPSLRISSNGNLELVDGKQNLVWSTNISTQGSSSNSTSAAALLLESGELVVKNGMGDVVWQSFDYPCDTILPNMLVGFDGKFRKRKFLTSWKGDNDPSAGKFLVGLESQTPTQVFIWINNGSTPVWRSGPWDRTKFIGLPEMNYLYQSGFKVDDDPIQGTKYFSYTLLDSTISYIDISYKGVLNFMLSENGSNWFRNWGAHDMPCDRYGVCGPFGVCTTSESPLCKCLDNFLPKSDEEWNKQNWTRGCVRQTKLFCDSNTSNSVSSRGNDDGFQKWVRMKVPDFHEYIKSLDSELDCRMYCLNNCSCQAYAFVNNIGCLAWYKDLIDMQQFSFGGTDMFIRLAHADLGEKKQIKLIVSLAAICFIGILCSIVFGWHRLQRNKKGIMKGNTKYIKSTGTTVASSDPLQDYIREHDRSELIMYDFDCISIATNTFSDTNKLGEGGFGPVYKGKLQDEKEIAVKRLSSSSRQGIEEFKNEMLLISKLQHTNLVKIFGCCVKEDEKLLIYEFLPNKSLDTFLFDPTKRALLDWASRFNIIRGVARGLLYLHHDSCLKVIHRDLKVSNILLDEKMNPKISDFGLARIVEGAHNLVNTHKVVGTLGYISPEYAMGGIFSEKSDVYSFGVLLLEIISGKKNTSFSNYEQQLGFLPYAWNLWSEGRGVDLADEVLNHSYSSSELLRCLHIGLLCVQDNAADRPTMPDVTFMLSSSVIDGPLPKRPVFTFQSPVYGPKPQYQYVSAFSANEATMSLIEGRSLFPLAALPISGILPTIYVFLKMNNPSYSHICFSPTMGALAKHHSFSTILLLLTSLSFFSIAISKDTLSETESLGIGQTLVSAGEVFELGFFEPGRNSRWYLGIWYKKIEQITVVWVANRDNPILNNNSSSLNIGSDGKLSLVDESGKVYWSSNQSQYVGVTKNPILQLLDSGNLVIKEANEINPSKYHWQSFDYPTHTLLPEMKLGWNLKTGLERYISSWKTLEDPSTGDYNFKLDYHGFPEVFLRQKQTLKYRSGPWNGLRFSGVPEMNPANGINFNFVVNSEEVYYSFSEQGDNTDDPALTSRLIVATSGEIQRFTWIESRKTWNQYWYSPKDQCDSFGECGPYGLCDANASPVCQCMKGFRPKNPSAWSLRDGSDGCERETELECGNKDKFMKVKNVKLPESGGAVVDMEMRWEECKVKCLENCSCSGYSPSRIQNGGSGCVMWFGNLVDMRSYTEGGQEFYLRLAASELDGGRKTKRIVMIVGIVAGIAVLLSAGLITCFLRRRTNSGSTLTRRRSKGPLERSQDFLLNSVVVSSKKERYSDDRSNDDLELPLFDVSSVAAATDNFSDENKLGQGGFGVVYKGLVEGELIAVKRLSKNSGQGIEEFKNEVRLIARLQHRNLVRLLGCCVDVDEKMLIYEYMENKSLDSFLFDKAKKYLLDWKKRFNIICGIARGLLYLHQDSRFRIIHRDLKAGNILLDGELDPKISDFGMARIFGQDQTEANTKKVVGTYGYMSPEYAMDGLFSIKSDVFSFGVLVLEIVSGKKNRGFYYSNSELNLLGHAWELWNEGRALGIVDPSVGDSFLETEVLRCMQVGLLCVQERAEDRPTMSSVVLMLNSETASLPQPKNPGFCLGRRPETESSSSKQDESCTVNQASFTVLDPR
ncbi:uncharacterized protein LOC126789562 [Argentina anserina]|uniref:uncharacterized protein LOC126789562 n=1 Tax=Argentina anserina TaxID=57926 RepID=UPI0021764EDE|nr:uncharacterized protein LOC126789562 [Potentilla anserina]